MPKPVQPRYATPREAGIEQLDEKKAKYADNNLKSFLFTNLGLIVDDNGRVSKRNLVTPMMFVMGKNDKGKDFPLDVNDLPYKPGSREFTEQIMMGNVFVYPAGKEKPVQLQIRPGPPNVRPDLIFSDPLEPEQMPAPPVKPLTRRQKILRFLSLGFAYRREQRAWEQAQREHADVQTKLRDSLTVSPRELEA